VNEDPTIVCVSEVTVAENIPIETVLLTAVSNDVDAGATNTFSISGTDAASFNIDSSGQLTFNESPNYEAKSSYSINVITTDQGELYASHAVTITITNVNEAPVAYTLENQTVNQDLSFNYTFQAFTDVDISDVLTYTATNVPSWVIFNNGTRTFSGLPTNNNVGTSTITVIATDLSGATTSASFNLTVVNVNDSPVAYVLTNQSVNQDVSFNYTFAAFTDVDISYGDVLTYTAPNKPDWLSIDSETRTFSGLPTNANVGTSTITVISTDLSGATASASFTLTVVNVNDAPTGSVTISGILTQGQTLTANNTLADIDGLRTFTYRWDASGVPISGATSMTYILTQAEAGKHITVTISYIDGYGTPESVTSAPTEKINQIPIIISIESPINLPTIYEDASMIQLNFVRLLYDLSYNDDIDDSINSFVVKSIESGSLQIGDQPWNISSNNIIDASNTAYWTPVANANGLLSAFKVSIRDSSLTESLNSEYVKIYITPVNDPPSGSVIISNMTPTQGQTLNASHTLVDSDGIVSLTYKWKADNIDISGATTSSLVLQEAQVNKIISVVVTYIDSYSISTSVSSANTSAVVNVNNVPSGSVIISNMTPSQGQTLTASHTLVDSDGVFSLTYQWKANNVDISGTTITTLVLGESHVNKVISVVATYIDSYSISTSVSSANTSSVVNVNDTPTGNVTISNMTPSQYQTLTAAHTLVDSDGIVSFTYKWKATGVDISGATTDTLVLQEVHVNKVISVVVTYIDSYGISTSVSSANTSAVVNVDDTPSGSVIISNMTPTQGQTLNASHTLVDSDGVFSLTYKWKADNVDITGATTSSLVLQEAHVNKIISVVATYIDSYGTSTSVSSATTSAVVNVNESPSGSVIISNMTPSQGQTLNASHTLVDSDGVFSVTYQWKANNVDISGATTYTLVLQEAQVNKVISVVATYIDSYGISTSVSSANTSSVINVNNTPTGSVIISNMTPSQGQTLSASHTLVDSDGVFSLTYKWKESGIDISGATTDTLVLQQAHVNKIISVVATYIDNYGITTSVSSLNTSAVLNVNDDPSGNVTISGTVREDSTLSVTHNLSDIDGLGQVTYKWQANEIDISGAILDSYTLTKNDVDKYITVQASYTDGHGTHEIVTSLRTTPVESLIIIDSSSNFYVTDYSVNTVAQIIATATNVLTYSISGTNANLFTINPSNGVITFINKIYTITNYVLKLEISNGTSTKTQDIIIYVHYNSYQLNNVYKISASNLYSAGYSVVDLYNAAYTINNIRIAGVSISEMKNAGINNSNIIQCGYTPIELSLYYDISFAPTITKISSTNSDVTSTTPITQKNTTIISITENNKSDIEFQYQYSIDNGVIWRSGQTSKSNNFVTFTINLPINSTYNTSNNFNMIFRSTFYNMVYGPPSVNYALTTKLYSDPIIGTVLEGYVSGATITIRDMSNNVIAGPVLTDIGGNFFIEGQSLPTHYVVHSEGGIDIATNLPISYPLTSVVNNTIGTDVTSSTVLITPITSIIASIVASQVSSGAVIDIVTASEKVAIALDIPVSMLKVDYIETTNILVAVAAVKMSTITNNIAAATGLSGINITNSIADIINTTTTTSKLLIDASIASTIINNVVTTIQTTTGVSTVIHPSVISSVSSLIVATSTIMDAPNTNLSSLYKTSIGSIAVANIITPTSGDVTQQLSSAVSSAVTGQITGNICFKKGTKIVTDQGIIEIEKMTKKNSIRGKYVKLISKTTNIDDYLIKISKGGLYENVPNTDTYVTGEHMIYYNREMIRAKKLVNGKTIKKVDSLNETVYNVLLEGEEVGKMIANGLISETLNPKGEMVKLLCYVETLGMKEREEVIEEVNRNMKKEHERRKNV
jgi:predicted glycoside hydrolase/deacetylase ChbG (UPF0249 family)